MHALAPAVEATWQGHGLVYEARYRLIRNEPEAAGQPVRARAAHLRGHRAQRPGARSAAIGACPVLCAARRRGPRARALRPHSSEPVWRPARDARGERARDARGEGDAHRRSVVRRPAARDDGRRARDQLVRALLPRCRRSQRGPSSPPLSSATSSASSSSRRSPRASSPPPTRPPSTGRGRCASARSAPPSSSATARRSWSRRRRSESRSTCCARSSPPAATACRARRLPSCSGPIPTPTRSPHSTSRSRVFASSWTSKAPCSWSTASSR